MSSENTGSTRSSAAPDIKGAHEKGGVEGEIGRFRRRHLVPVPKVASLAALNELIATGDRLDDDRVITGRPITIGAAFATEATALMGLPAEAFDCARLLQARVDNRARVSVRQCFYSVPARYAGRRLPVRLAARTVEIYDGPTLVARHERAVGRYVEVLALDHYLEVLKTKPGGLPGATALAQAKARGVFTASHQAYWDAARRARGDAAGTRALIADPAGPPHHVRRRADRSDGPGRRLGVPGSRDWCSSTPAATPPTSYPWSRSVHWPATTDRHPLWPTTTTYSPEAHHEHHRPASRRPSTPPRKPASALRHASCTCPPCAPKRSASPKSPTVNANPTCGTSPRSSPPRSTTAPNDAAPGASTTPSSHD